MTSTLERISSPRGEGNFWRRVGAVVIDWGIIGIGLCFIAAIGYGLTDGQVRMAQAPLAFTQCLPADAPPENFDPAAPMPGLAPEIQAEVMGDPSTFRADAVADCRTFMLGSEIDRKAHLAEATGAQRFYILPVDGAFRVTQPWIYLDLFFGLALLVVLTLLEGLTGASLGKRIVRLRVQSPGGGRAGPGRALVRNLIIWGPAAALGLVNLAVQNGLIELGGSSAWALGLTGVALAFVLWPFALLMGLIISGSAPFWDQVAGVRVVRI